MPIYAAYYLQEGHSLGKDGKPIWDKRSVIVQAETEEEAKPLIEAHLACYRRHTSRAIVLDTIVER